MERLQQNPVEFLSLSTAASIVYHQVMGKKIAAADVAQMNAILHDVAHALANVAPIYSADPDAGTLKQLEPVELLFGVFQRGATVFRTPRNEYRNLLIRRSDMRSAIAILLGARVAFGPRRSHPG